MIGQQLCRIQRLDDTINLIFEAGRLEFVFELRQPFLGGRDLGDDPAISALDSSISAAYEMNSLIIRPSARCRTPLAAD